MVGMFFGAACGAVEFMLLLCLVNAITAGKPIPLWVIPAKIGALALFFLVVAFWRPQELYLAGIGTAAVLIIGAVIQFLRKRNVKKTEPIKSLGRERLL